MGAKKGRFWRRKTGQKRRGNGSSVHSIRNCPQINRAQRNAEKELRLAFRRHPDKSARPLRTHCPQSKFSLLLHGKISPCSPDLHGTNRHVPNLHPQHAPFAFATFLFSARSSLPFSHSPGLHGQLPRDTAFSDSTFLRTRQSPPQGQFHSWRRGGGVELSADFRYNRCQQ